MLRTIPSRVAILSTLAAVHLACADVEDDREPLPAAGISVAISLAADACGVVAADATVAAPDLDPPLGPFDLDVTGESILGHIAEVPAGPDRLVSVRAYDARWRVVYQGSTTVDVVAGETATATMELLRNHDNCPPSPEAGDIDVSGTLEDGDLPDPGLPFAGTEIAFTAEGVLYFLDELHHQIRRYDVAGEVELPALVGSGEVTTMAIAPDGSTAYLAYAGGRIDDFDLRAGTRGFFAAAPGTISSMVVTGGYLFVVDASGAWSTHALYARDTGSRVASSDWRDTGRSFAWAPGLGRLFYLDSGVSPTDLHYVPIDTDAGTLGPDVESPYHGDYSLPNPIRVLPDESQVVVGSGLFFSTADLTYQTSMGFSFADIAFADGRYYLAEAVGDTTRIRVLDAEFALLAAQDVDGAPQALFVLGEDLVLVTRGAREGTTRVQRLPLADL